MDEPRRDDAFDRALRRALAADGPGASGAHVDAELAAAWMERRLDAAASRSIEAHFADCPDCQAMMATLARIAPDVPTDEAVTWWRRLRAGWVVPATVATAAALVIWIALPQQRTAPERGRTLSDPPTASAPPAASQPVQPTQPSAPAAPSSNDTGARAAAPPPAEFRKKTANVEQERALADRSASPPAVPAPALERRADAAAPEADARVRAEAPMVDAQTSRRATVAGEAPPAAAPAAPRPAAPARQEAAERSRTLSESVAAGAVQGGAVALRAGGTLAVAAADGSARWRQVNEGIEFAPRGDGRFVATSLPVSANAIVAASAPGGTVCWMVGRAGLVVLSTDGVRFARTAVPTPVDLVAIAATDARTAVVTAGDGRRFRTTDSGATWSPVP